MEIFFCDTYGFSNKLNVGWSLILLELIVWFLFAIAIPCQ